EEEVVEDACPPEPAPRKDSVAAAEQQSIREMGQGDWWWRTQHRELHHEQITVVHQQRPPAEHPVYWMMVPARHGNEYERHHSGDQETHRVAHLEEDECRYDNAGRHQLAMPDEGRAATIHGEHKVEEEQRKAPQGEGGPTTVAAEVDPGIEITEFQTLLVAIHRKEGIQCDCGTCATEEDYSTER